MMMKKILLFVLVFIPFTSFAENTPTIIANCSSTGIVSEFTYTISFKRERFSAVVTRGDAYFIVSKHPEGVSVIFDLLDSIYDVDDDGSHVLKAESQMGILDILIAGRGSRLKIKLNDETSPLNIDVSSGIICSHFETTYQ